jgi:hypothetical protein
MSFESDPSFDKKNHNYKPKCFYIMGLIKMKDAKVWQKYQAQFQNLKAEDSHAFYETLVEEYKKIMHLADSTPAEAPNKAKKEEKKPAPKKEVKPAPAKKAEKKPAKKEAKPTKKVPAKKAAKKVEKKVVKKAAKKAAKKKK